MASDDARWLPADWQPHVDVERDHIRLVVCDEHLPKAIFLYESGDLRHVIDVTVRAQRSQSFAVADDWARLWLHAWLVWRAEEGFPVPA